MRISDWSSDVCSSDLRQRHRADSTTATLANAMFRRARTQRRAAAKHRRATLPHADRKRSMGPSFLRHARCARPEEHTSELQSQMRISYAVFCLKKKKNKPKVTRPGEHRRNKQI